MRKLIFALPFCLACASAMANNGAGDAGSGDSAGTDGGDGWRDSEAIVIEPYVPHDVDLIGGYNFEVPD